MTLTGLFTWLGGGQDSEVAYRHERTGYAMTGAAVLLFAIVSGLITALALASTGTWAVLAIILVALLVAVLAGAIARALATARPAGGPDRLGLLARVGVAVLAGGLIAELAAIVVFGGSVDRTLDERAQRSVASAPQVVSAQADLDKARADRTALDQSIAKAQADVDRSLVIARCELSPSPDCPQLQITRVPGRGPEAQTANDMLDDARKQLATAQGRVDALDTRLADAEKAVATAESTAFTGADRGLGARWQAMNDYTTHHAGAMPLRILTIIALIALALLPLVLRWWRGQTSFDRRAAFLNVQNQAEHEADAAIAVKRAETRVAAEALLAEQQLTAARLAAEADTAIDRERQRTRIVAAIGGLRIGITEPPRRPELPAAPADDRKDSSVSAEGFVTPNLPAPVTARALAPAPKTGGGLALPLIGTVPFTDTAARLIRPLVPSFVANAIDNATHPLRTARQAFEEVEEITFTLKRTRKVTIDTQDSHPGYQLAPGSPEALHAQRIAATVVDADYGQPDPRYSALPEGAAAQPYGLSAQRHDELGGRGQSELPGRGQRELPRGH
ncbi:DUF4407 domain-containing protein [Nocardia sp. NPDC060256]|uniref:DUF4407 domain-containing protein n=1 Tax=unclassified Nocardia TaxID=2637762 RepID=UPI003663DC74